MANKLVALYGHAFETYHVGPNNRDGCFQASNTKAMTLQYSVGVAINCQLSGVLVL